MAVTLWEGKATEFMASLAGAQGAAIFVVITGLLAKQFSGKHTEGLWLICLN